MAANCGSAPLTKKPKQNSNWSANKWSAQHLAIFNLFCFMHMLTLQFWKQNFFVIVCTKLLVLWSYGPALFPIYRSDW